MRRRNPIAKELRTTKFKQKVVKNKKHYNRKNKTIEEINHHFEIYE
jgi:hypothetical protein